MPESHHTEVVEVVDRPVSISYVVHTLRAYGPVILLSTVAVALVYVVIAVALYVFSPTQRITTQRFRLDFEGAAEARYPNGIKFSTSDITSTPILLKVFHDNELERFTAFSNFSRGIVILEANPDYERLAADYQARLADPKLSPIDRERIQREWQSKSAALAKNDYSINWMWTRETSKVPDSTAKKVLLDVLSMWARYAVNDQHILRYRLAVLSPQVIGTADSDGEPIIAIQVLRSKIYKVLHNIDDLRGVPGSELLRSSSGMTLEEVHLRLEELVRFRLDPLLGRVASSGLIANRPATLRFLESQLAYDQRQLKSAQDVADSIRQSLAVYTMDQRALPMEAASSTTAATPREAARSAQVRGDNVVPQLSDSFIDRMLTLMSQATDAQYRQQLVDDYRKAAQAVIPAEQAVSYDQDALNLMKTATGGGTLQAADVRAEITASQNEVRQLVGQINEIYTSISSNLNPSKELYTLVAPPVSRSENSRSLKRLALYGVAVLAIALSLIVALCFVHARVRREEAEENYAIRASAPAEL